MTPSFDKHIVELKREYPEWQPWLAVVQEILDETVNPVWDAVVPARTGPQQEKVPLLTGMTLALEQSLVRHLLEQLIRVASVNGTPKMATLKSALHADLDILSLFKASLCHDGDHVRELAAVLGADAGALQAVVGLIPLPFLQACNRRWASSISESWTEGYCPVCGAWPAFAEVRGIDRSRYFRCGRCGSGWQAQCLFCPYCAMTDHNELGSLVPEKGGSNSVIDACKRCLGYVKTFTTLQGSVPGKVIVDDLASVDLDIAAMQQGYRRPEGAGYSLDVVVIGKAMPKPSIFAWSWS
jgi:FdhE protein